jgi:hypothetical protein
VVVDDLLRALSTGPRTLTHLSQLLHCTPGQVEAALLQLRRGGYVDRAIPDQGACHSGCGMCSMKNFCPSQAPVPLPQETWRLTDKARARVQPSA